MEAELDLQEDGGFVCVRSPKQHCLTSGAARREAGCPTSQQPHRGKKEAEKAQKRERCKERRKEPTIKKQNKPDRHTERE